MTTIFFRLRADGLDRASDEATLRLVRLRVREMNAEALASGSVSVMSPAQSDRINEHFRRGLRRKGALRRALEFFCSCCLADTETLY